MSFADDLKTAEDVNSLQIFNNYNLNDVIDNLTKIVNDENEFNKLKKDPKYYDNFIKIISDTLIKLMNVIQENKIKGISASKIKEKSRFDSEIFDKLHELNEYNKRFTCFP